MCRGSKVQQKAWNYEHRTGALLLQYWFSMDVRLALECKLTIRIKHMCQYSRNGLYIWMLKVSATLFTEIWCEASVTLASRWALLPAPQPLCLFIWFLDNNVHETVWNSIMIFGKINMFSFRSITFNTFTVVVNMLSIIYSWMNATERALHYRTCNWWSYNDDVTCRLFDAATVKQWHFSHEWLLIYIKHGLCSGWMEQ